MSNEGPQKFTIDREVVKKLEVALARQAKVQSELFDDTVVKYVWKWLPAAQGLFGKDLMEMVSSRNAAFSVVGTKHEPLTNTTSVIVAFVQYPRQGITPLERRACRMDYRVLNPGGLKSDNIVLEFGHEEIPFPEDIQTTR